MIPEELNNRGNAEKVYDLTTDDIANMIDGDRVNIEDVIDKNIIIEDVIFQKSDYGDGNYAILQMKINDGLYSMTTGSKAIVRQLTENKNKMPFQCRIIKQKSMNSEYEYFTLSPPALVGRF